MGRDQQATRGGHHGEEQRGEERHGEEQYRALSSRLAGTVTASRSQPPLVLLHGFTQTGRSWSPVVEALEDGLPLVLPDAPGHGGSATVRAGLWRTADLLVQTVGQPAVWAGYSMGGRTALHVALAHPDQVLGLVLVSATAGIEDARGREARVASDEALAARIEQEGTAPFLTWWLAQPLFATLPKAHDGLEDRLANTPAGLASSLRLAGAGRQEPLWERLSELRDRGLPVHLIAGELDQDYRDRAQRMAVAIGPTAALTTVAGAGHACHLERPHEVAAAIAALYARRLPVPAAHDKGQQSEGQPDRQ
jgi:2-succinyl-6-hydroxy-2,4-cyclohexadiene-1-carboxylate synthase